MEKKALLTQEEAQLIIEDFIANTQSATITRQGTFATYENFVIEGEQWLEDEKPTGDKPCLTFNQSQDFINTYLAKLFPRNPETGILSIGVQVKTTQTEEKETQEKEILDTYEDNKFAETVLEQGQNFLVGGAACIYYPQNPISKTAKIISINPTTVYLGWNGNTLEQFAFEDEVSLQETEEKNNSIWLIEAIKKFLTGETEKTRRFKKVKRLTYWDTSFQIIRVGENFKITKNEHGFVPASWIPNQPKSHTREGIPEAKKLYSLEKEYNQRSSDFAQRVKANTKPTLAITTEMDAKDLVFEDIADKGVLPLEKGDDAKFLLLQENAELIAYLKELKQSMATKMAVNDAVAGEIKSNISSLSMVYYFSPLMDRIGLKRIYWDQAFREINSAILTYKFGQGKYKTNPIYEPILLSDVKTKYENTILLLENKLISHADAIDVLRGSENANEKVAEILAEKEKFEPPAPKDDFVEL